MTNIRPITEITPEALEPPADVPAFDVDLHAEEMLIDPYPVYKQLRDAGPVVWLAPLQMFALARYDEVVAALLNWKVFSSARGVGMNEFINSHETMLHMDPPEHDKLRKVAAGPLHPKATRELEPRLRAVAEATIAELTERGTFDGVADLASRLPLDVVSDLIGLPADSRGRLLEWGDAAFDAFGRVDHPRTQRGFGLMQEVSAYMGPAMQHLKAGSWSDHLLQAGQRGELSPEHCMMLMNDYVYPSIGTTVHAISSGIKLFAEHPDQWDLVRADRALLPGAVSEILRIEAPIQWFTRFITQDVEIGQVRLPAGSRAVMLYASANRDERKFGDPDRFDVTRRAADQLAFGKGKHACMGMPLARMEISVVFDVLADKVKRIEVGESKFALNNVLRGLESLEVTVS